MTKEELKKELHLLSYDKLEEEFKNRGVGQAWKEGDLKEDLIESATVAIMKIDASIMLEKPIKIDIDTSELENILQNTDYHLLRKKFEEYGIVGQLRGGQKKKELIASALRRYNEIKLLLNDGLNPILSKGDLIKRVEADDLLRIANEKERERQSEINKKAEEKREAEKIIKIDLTKEQILKNLKSIDLNLRSASPAQRVILLRKRDILNKDLEEKSKKPHPFKKLSDGSNALEQWLKENPQKTED